MTRLLDRLVAWRTSAQRPARDGKVRPLLLLFALGVPLPIILVIALVRGCS